MNHATLFNIPFVTEQPDDASKVIAILGLIGSPVAVNDFLVLLENEQLFENPATVLSELEKVGAVYSFNHRHPHHSLQTPHITCSEADSHHLFQASSEMSSVSFDIHKSNTRREPVSVIGYLHKGDLTVAEALEHPLTAAILTEDRMIFISSVLGDNWKTKLYDYLHSLEFNGGEATKLETALVSRIGNGWLGGVIEMFGCRPNPGEFLLGEFNKHVRAGKVETSDLQAEQDALMDRLMEIRTAIKLRTK